MINLFIVIAVVAGPHEEVAPNSPTALSPLSEAAPTDANVRPAKLAPSVSAKPQQGIAAVAPEDSSPRRPMPLSQPTRSREFSRPTDTTRESEETPMSSSRQWAWWVTTGVGLVFVLGVITVMGRIARKAIPGASLGDLSGPIHVLHRSYLTPKHAVCLVKCGDRILVVGLAGDRMNTLSEIHDPQEIDFVRGQCMQVRPKSTTQAFREMFQGKTPDDEIPPPKKDQAEDRLPEPNGKFVDHLSSLRDRITEWKSKVRA